MNRKSFISKASDEFEYPPESWLPPIIALNFRDMVTEELLSQNEKAFFTYKELSTFWENAGNYLSSVPANYLNNASSYLVGCFLNPLHLYGKTGTVDCPSKKTEIRARQREADDLMRDAAKQAKILSDTLKKLEKTTPFLPCETRLAALIRPLIDDHETNKWSSYSDGARTYEAISLLEKSLREYPRTSSVFNGVPGMESNKSTWRDWLRESRVNVGHMLRIYPGEFNIREADWVILASVLIGEGISRDAVHNELQQ